MSHDRHTKEMLLKSELLYMTSSPTISDDSWLSTPINVFLLKAYGDFCQNDLRLKHDLPYQSPTNRDHSRAS